MSFVVVECILCFLVVIGRLCHVKRKNFRLSKTSRFFSLHIFSNLIRSDCITHYTDLKNKQNKQTNKLTNLKVYVFVEGEESWLRRSKAINLSWSFHCTGWFIVRTKSSSSSLSSSTQWKFFFYKNTISHTVTDDNAHFEFVFRRKFRFFSFGLDKHLLRNVKKVFFLFLNLFSDWNEFWIFFSVLNIFFGTKQYLKQNKNLEKTMQMNETVPFFALEGSRHKTNVGFSFFSVEISVLFLFVLMEISWRQIFNEF